MPLTWREKSSPKPILDFWGLPSPGCARAVVGYMATAPEDMFLALLHASDWAHGLLAPADDHAPSTGWLDVVKRRRLLRPRPP